MTQLTDLPTITAEINAYKRVAGEAIFEIGKRLKHVKERKLADSRGGWTSWLRDVEMSTSQADRFIKITERLGDTKFPTSGSITMGILDEISTLPSDIDRSEFVSQLHTVPSTGATKTVDEMTVRELREVKAQLKAEREVLTARSV